ncbi:MAG: hypothetical protein COB53_00320 [Elusimicrobia bacterium]|nr:MAG: hypothetical protein COB53_00320 [Elusimicrobiota bacterium]
MTRVCYFGYGDIGRHCLRSLVDAGVEVVGVFCRESDRRIIPDRPSVFSLANELGLRCYDVLRPTDKGFLEELRKNPPDYAVSIQYDRILKPSFLEIPTHGSLNLHFAPLPRLRGCFPTKWAIINNEPSGVTLHHILPGVDDGNLIAQEIVVLAADETDETLYHRLVKSGKRVFDAQVAAIADKSVSKGTPQNAEESSYYPKAMPHNGTIDWTRNAAWIERFIRAFTFAPHPAAQTSLGAVAVQITAPIKINGFSSLAPGAFERDESGALRIGCGDGSILVDRFIVDSKDVDAGGLIAVAGGLSRFK